ncbi:MAG: glycosyltransferase involved in cell wall biosynthesis [Rhodothermales bacterium]|jgi:glycosyltransferase involved in cell wall biosynthesis
MSRVGCRKETWVLIKDLEYKPYPASAHRELDQAGTSTLGVPSFGFPSSSMSRTGRKDLSSLRVAVVHDWLPVAAGAELVLEQILAVFPQADVFTLLNYLEGKDAQFLEGHSVSTSFIERLPGARTRYRYYLPLAPLAIEQFDLREYDLVISSSYVVAKGALTGPDQLHVSYIHSPIRYAWDEYFSNLDALADRGVIVRGLLRLVLHYMRLYDGATASRPDALLANSAFVARRIRKYWGREAQVLYPPVAVPDARPRVPGDYFVTASRLVPYKRVDVLVQAFAQLPDERLIVLGDGPELRKLRGLSTRNVEFMGHVSREELLGKVAGAKAFLFAAREDFGIAPVEAQALGTPVIAYGRGGVTETVVEGRTGMFFESQTPGAVAAAVSEFEESDFDRTVIAEHGRRYGAARFRNALLTYIEGRWDSFQAQNEASQLTMKSPSNGAS